MELLTPDFFKRYGINIDHENDLFIIYVIDEKIEISFTKDKFLEIHKNYPKISVITTADVEGNSAWLMGTDDYTVDEFKYLCKGLRINLPNDPSNQLDKRTGDYSC